MLQRAGLRERKYGQLKISCGQVAIR